jgi:hypothetical protein
LNASDSVFVNECSIRSVGTRVQLRLASVVAFSEDAMRILAEQGQRMEELVGQVWDIRQSVDQSINGGRKQEMETLSHGDAETRVCSGEALIPVDDKTKELEVQVLW